MGEQPRVVANDWRILTPPALGDWTPRLSVAVVVPAHDPVHLEHTLAALAAQSYPSHLIEVVVVDDGSTPPVALPRVRPPRTEVIRLQGGWGRAAGCHYGAVHTSAEVLHWLDADVVQSRHAIEAHMRWHHEIDYAVVLGRKRFAKKSALDHLSPEQLQSSIAAGTDPTELARGGTSPHWSERSETRLDSLSTAGPRAMRYHIGLSGSVSRALYFDSDGMPSDLRLGEDIVLGYRLREAGAVFVPDPLASCLHLGTSGVMRAADAVNRYNKPYIMQKVPEFRGHRLQVGRSYEVPYLEVQLAADRGYEATRLAVDTLLDGAVPDIVVTLIADWSRLEDGRRDVLADPYQELHLIKAAYAGEQRVRCRAATPLSEATFRLHLASDQHLPVGKALANLLHDMEMRHLGSVRVHDGPDLVAEIQRTAAVARARRISATCRVGDVYEAVEVEASAAGFVGASAVQPPKQVRGVMR